MLDLSEVVAVHRRHIPTETLTDIRLVLEPKLADKLYEHWDDSWGWQMIRLAGNTNLITWYGVLRAGKENLTKIPGIGNKKAEAIIAACKEVAKEEPFPTEEYRA